MISFPWFWFEAGSGISLQADSNHFGRCFAPSDPLGGMSKTREIPRLYGLPLRDANPFTRGCGELRPGMPGVDSLEVLKC